MKRGQCEFWFRGHDWSYLAVGGRPALTWARVCRKCWLCERVGQGGRFHPVGDIALRSLPAEHLQDMVVLKT